MITFYTYLKSIIYLGGSMTEVSQEILTSLTSIQTTLDSIEKPFLTIDEASRYLGISKNTLYGYTSKKILSYYKLQGRRIFFKREDLESFVLNEGNRKSSHSEIEERAMTKLITEKGRKK